MPPSTSSTSSTIWTLRPTIPPRSEEPKVPPQLRALYEEVVGHTDAFCAEHLDPEYAGLAREMAAALSRKRPSPFLGGRPKSWAAGIVYALGQVNFLFDRSQTPHLEARQVCALFGLSQNNVAEKAKEIRRVLKIRPVDAKWWRPSQMGGNPLAWIVQLSNGMVVDARGLPLEMQEDAYERGLIPKPPHLEE